MFFTRHSLAFVFLAVLVSPACAIPTPKALVRRDAAVRVYTVQSLAEDGIQLVKTPSKVQEDIRDFIIVIAPRFDGGQPQKGSSSMHRFQLKGGKFCDSKQHWTCVAYVFIPTEDELAQLPPHTMFGAVIARQVITGTKDHHYREFQFPQSPEAKELQDKSYLDFLTTPSIEDWVENMAKPAHNPSDTVKKAAAILLSQKQTSVKRPPRHRIWMSRMGSQ
ncbi:hypothetical protein BDP27DRAFT_1453429 [Rhodocollybia butyracea]|uniref:Uncharacterized protein n=1 Tax=Rhodocollybia butyracea TaxID=206335 RepID=A0A9P5P9F8_9AGAR|nr:hypothetical protein BDP27DRAFT_1453429 [Rhodocollybia butyracea]